MENEKRLIYADALCEFFQNRYNYLRNASRRHLKDGRVFVDREIETGAIIAKEFLDKTKQAPTVDAVEVVRCKDCRHLEITGCYGECKRGYMGIVKPWDFCSYGERREG